MEFKVGDFAKPKKRHGALCCKLGKSYWCTCYVRVDRIAFGKACYYSIYDDQGNYCNSNCGNEPEDLEPYTPTPEQLEAMAVKEVIEFQKPKPTKETKPQLTYKKEIIYTRSDGTVFMEDEITYNDKSIQVKTLRLYSNLYKAWKGREFDE